jgi:hypothetical protein
VVGGSGHHLVMGCGSQRRPFFGSGIALCGDGDVRRGPTLAVSSVECGAACQRRPLWQRVVGHAMEGATVSEAMCRGLVTVPIGGELQLLGLCGRVFR